MAGVVVTESANTLAGVDIIHGASCTSKELRLKRQAVVKLSGEPISAP